MEDKFWSRCHRAGSLKDTVHLCLYLFPLLLSGRRSCRRKTSNSKIVFAHEQSILQSAVSWCSGHCGSEQPNCRCSWSVVRPNFQFFNLLWLNISCSTLCCWIIPMLTPQFEFFDETAALWDFSLRLISLIKPNRRCSSEALANRRKEAEAGVEWAAFIMMLFVRVH